MHIIYIYHIYTIVMGLIHICIYIYIYICIHHNLAVGNTLQCKMYQPFTEGPQVYWHTSGGSCRASKAARGSQPFFSGFPRMMGYDFRYSIFCNC